MVQTNESLAYFANAMRSMRVSWMQSVNNRSNMLYVLLRGSLTPCFDTSVNSTAAPRRSSVASPKISVKREIQHIVPR